MTEGPAPLDADTYIRLHQDHHPHLIAYARTLIGTPWPAEDAVAEAYFLVWRRLRAGEAVGDVPAALKATVRDLAMPAARRDRAQRVSYVDLLARVIEDLPQRWVKALWQAEAERQPPVAEAGRRAAAGTSPAAALERARDGMRQHFLRAQPGGPADPACGWCWERLPEHVRGADSPTQAEQVAIHVAGCADCRTRVEQLMAADARLSALVGPALMVLLSRGTADYLVPLARAGGAVAALSSLPSGGAHAGPAADTVKLPARTSEDRPPRHRARRRAGRAGRPVAVMAGAGALALAGRRWRPGWCSRAATRPHLSSARRALSPRPYRPRKRPRRRGGRSRRGRTRRDTGPRATAPPGAPPRALPPATPPTSRRGARRRRPRRPRRRRPPPARPARRRAHRRPGRRPRRRPHPGPGHPAADPDADAERHAQADPEPGPDRDRYSRADHDNDRAARRGAEQVDEADRAGQGDRRAPGARP
ncbi:zf-HC2 domain-containing protein [Streptomyces sp. FXJ1.4098]|nr:zf-HC2 domain-containing protein [Streptomyces sp. FXJ1.4098]